VQGLKAYTLAAQAMLVGFWSEQPFASSAGITARNDQRLLYSELPRRLHALRTDR